MIAATAGLESLCHHGKGLGPGRHGADGLRRSAGPQDQGRGELAQGHRSGEAPRAARGQPRRAGPIATQAEAEIRQRWLGKLAGVDVFTRDNVITIAVSLLLDAPKDLS